MATTAPTVQQKQILGTLLFELMTGEVTDETIALVDTLDREEVPPTFHEIVGYMHGMTTEPYLRYTVTTHLVRELAGEASQLAEDRARNEPPIDYPPLEV
jgi:hypothetical protein